MTNGTIRRRTVAILALRTPYQAVDTEAAVIGVGTHAQGRVIASATDDFKSALANIYGGSDVVSGR